MEEIVIFWFDTETTGLDPEKHGITALGVIIENNKQVIEEFQYSINPAPEIQFDPKALEVQGKTIEEIRSGMASEIVFALLKEDLARHVNKFNKKDKFVQAGYNVGFDDSFLRQFFIQNNDKYYGSWFINARIDVLTLVAERHAEKRLPVKNFKLATICDYLDSLQEFRALAGL